MIKLDDKVSLITLHKIKIIFILIFFEGDAHSSEIYEIFYIFNG